MALVSLGQEGDPLPKGSARRQQVIDAAAATFSRMGYHGASTRTIADALGIKVASLYFHIASKEDALAEICLSGTERSRVYLRQAMAEGDALAAQIRLFFHFQRENLIDHADYVSVAMRESPNLTGAAKQEFKNVTGAFRNELDAMFMSASARGDLNPAMTPRAARFIMIGTMRTISELYINGPIRQFDDIMTAWVEALIRSLAPVAQR